jgi:hypothetical protein
LVIRAVVRPDEDWGFSMQAIASYRRWSAITLTVMLLGALFTVPSAVARSGGSADKAARAVPTERILAIQTHTGNNAQPVVLGFGPIHAKGVDRQLSAHKDEFRFPNGSLFIRHQKVAGHHSRDPVTCLSRIFEHGTYQVVRGTGAYAGAHGHGHYRLNGKIVACTRQSQPEAFVIKIRAHGPLQL